MHMGPIHHSRLGVVARRRRDLYPRSLLAAEMSSRIYFGEPDWHDCILILRLMVMMIPHCTPSILRMKYSSHETMSADHIQEPRPLEAYPHSTQTPGNYPMSGIERKTRSQKP